VGGLEELIFSKLAQELQVLMASSNLGSFSGVAAAISVLAIQNL
jgi:hypothetical protein